MTTRNFEFHGLERLDGLILKLRDDIGYVSVEEVLTRNKTAMVGRADFSITELAAFMSLDAGRPSADAPFVLGDLTAAPTGPTAQDLAGAMTRFVRHTMGANMTGCARRVFKVSLWRPKGEGQYTSGRVACVDPDFDEDEGLDIDESPLADAVTAAGALVPVAAPAATVVVTPPPAPLNIEFMPEARPWRALSEAYTNMIGLLQTSYNHLANLHGQTINSQNQQNIRLQHVMETLVAELTNLRLGVREADDEKRGDERENRVREELGRQFIAELGTFGRVVAAGKFGMAPELVELAEIVNASPELMEAMKAPEVRKMLRDEKTRKELAELLTVAARGSAASAPPPPSPTPSTPTPPAAA